MTSFRTIMGFPMKQSEKIVYPKAIGTEKQLPKNETLPQTVIISMIPMIPSVSANKKIPTISAHELEGENRLAEQEVCLGMSGRDSISI